MNASARQPKTRGTKVKHAVIGIAITLGIILLFMVSVDPGILQKPVSLLMAFGALVVATAVLNFFLALGRWKHRAFVKYHDQYKKTVIEALIRFIEPSLKYEADSRLSKKLYERSGLYPRPYGRYEGDDLISGKIGKTPFSFSELHTQYATEGKDIFGNPKDIWHTIFYGLFFVCEFNKMFKGRTYVFPDKLEKSLGDLGAALQREKTAFGELVKLEDPEFERLFAVYGTDQVVARYVLSTSLMARLTAFQKKAGRELRLSFVDSDLYVAIHYGHNLFQPPLNRSAISYDDIRGYFEALQLVLGIVDDLNLNTRIWGARAVEHLKAKSGSDANEE
ncbi:MAG: DUF3137 domain-containing protein [Kiritimatiellae bacterium]|nr:DUF3137 domain-containing protein [Kiritimatiellia bacterium]